MGLRDQTKNLFADTLIEMMKCMPLDKIRVDDLCRACGANRRSFYYHFKDKYDLTAWIFLRDYESSMAETNGKYSLKHVIKTLEKLKSKENFYKKAFSDRSQNAITQHLYEMFVELGRQKAMAYLERDELTVEELYDIKSHSFATVGHTKEWLEGKTDFSPEKFASLQYRSMPDLLKKAYSIDEM